MATDPDDTSVARERCAHARPAVTTATLAAFNNVLHLMHREPTTGDTIWWSELNTTTWTVGQALNELGQPSLAPGATKLVMSHGSYASNHAIFYTTFQ